jgi:uncharacterized protein
VPYTWSQTPLPSAAPCSAHHLVKHEFTGTGGSRSAYFQAGLHADEHPGFLVTWHLLQFLQQACLTKTLRGRVVVVSVANPIGLAQNVFGGIAGRFDLHNGENFNRNFPSIADEVLARLSGRAGATASPALLKDLMSEVLAERVPSDATAALKHALLAEAVQHDIVLDLHCDSCSILHVYAGEDQRRRALSLAGHLNARAVLLETEAGGQPFDESYARPWRLMRSRGLIAEDVQGFSATVELRGQADTDDATARNDALALLKFLEAEGLLQCTEDPVHLSPQEPSVHALEAVHHQLAPVSGLVVYRVRPGQAVSKGELMAEIVLLDARAGAPRVAVAAEIDGLVVAIRNMAMIRGGQRVALLAGSTRLPDRVAGQLLKNF